MTIAISRRGALGMTGGGLAVLAMPAGASEFLSLPASPMLLTRTLVRHLADGETITVERDWRIKFERSGAGIAITGSQQSASVSAPAKLDALARIEEGRDASGVFPIFLDKNGRIVSAGSGYDAQSIEDAVKVGEIMLASATAAEARDGLRRLQQAGESLLSALPADLFFPTSGETRRNQPITLERGLSGSFEVVYSASLASDGPWLGKASRSVTTQIGDDVKSSRESWILAPA